MGMDGVPRCQHLKTNGTQCGSPALRSRRLCFFHESYRLSRKRIVADTQAPRPFDLPLLEDANSVQVALMKVIQMLASGRMDHRTAGLVLYALQTAAVNMRSVKFEAGDVTDTVIDRDDVHRTCIGGPQWFEEDFEDEEEAEAEEEGQEQEREEETEGEAEAEDAVAAAPAQALPASRRGWKRKPPPQNRLGRTSRPLPETGCRRR
jgi:hypothetical protein